MIGRLALIAAIAFAIPASARQAQPDKRPAAAAQVATARAYAERLITEANAGAYFVNITDSDTPRVRHRHSGMICFFLGARDIDKITLYPAGGGIAAGDDVSCSTRDHAVWYEVTLYATRYDPMPTETEDLRGVSEAITQRFSTARPHSGLPAASRASLSQPKKVVFDVDSNVGPLISIGLVSHVGEWGFTARASGSRDAAATVNRIADDAFLTMLATRQPD